MRVTEVRVECCFESGEREFICTQRARERMLAEPLNNLKATNDQTGLRRAEQFVSTE